MTKWTFPIPRARSRPALLLAALGLAALAHNGASSYAGAVSATEKVEPRVLEQIAARGEANFWVVLGEVADVAPAFGIADRAQRGAYVYEGLREVADRSQGGVRALLDARSASYKPFWIVNAIRVRGGETLLQELAARPDVKRIYAERTFHIPPPAPGRLEQRVETVEWNIDRINAPQVWSTFNIRGEGTVVANIDTGVQYNHPALVRQYRGNLGGGSFDHNYNWFDPSQVCGSPSNVPCDNNSHGTHTMGTMVGDDGMPGPNQIGVAPNAKWIAAKGCETNSCSDFALLASAQWVLAPTDLSGNNPRPDLRPDVVNNSWGGSGGDPWYLASVKAWVAAGIFPAFANGNSGSACGTSISPGDYVASYSAGSFTMSNNPSSFSSRGPSDFAGPATAPASGGEIKPNIMAPGSSVRSSVPVNSYASFSGTSMASPHVAGTVALIWSAAPSIRGNIGATRHLLDNTAIDVSALNCGGTADDNNVWGEGRLDAFAAVDNSPHP